MLREIEKKKSKQTAFVRKYFLRVEMKIIRSARVGCSVYRSANISINQRDRGEKRHGVAARYTTHILTSYKSPTGKLHQCEIDGEIAEERMRRKVCIEGGQAESRAGGG